MTPTDDLRRRAEDMMRKLAQMPDLLESGAKDATTMQQMYMPASTTP